MGNLYIAYGDSEKFSVYVYSTKSEKGWNLAPATKAIANWISILPDPGSIYAKAATGQIIININKQNITNRMFITLSDVTEDTMPALLSLSSSLTISIKQIFVIRGTWFF